MGRLLLIPLVLIALLAGSAVWSSRQADTRADFVFVNKGDIRSLDPNTLSWAEDILLSYGLYEGLYALDPGNLRPVPGMADRIEVSDDKLTYTFHIRPNTGWTNGDPVTANDFMFAWKRMLDHPGDYTYLFDYIGGAADYRAAVAAGRPADFNTVGIKLIDARTLKVTLSFPLPIFPDIVAFPPFFPCNERAMRPFREPSGAYRPEFMRPPNLVTNGPYRLARWDFKQRLRLIANDHYWDRKNVRSRVIDQVIVDDNKLGEWLRYETHTVDWLADVDGETTAELLNWNRQHPGHERKDLHVFPAFGTYFYAFNCDPTLKDGRPNPFVDKRVRRAFALAVDRRPIVDTVTRCGERVAEHYIPNDLFPNYHRPPGQKYDPVEARRLLAAAGYADPSTFPRVSLLYSTVGQHGDVAQVVVRQWKQVLGVNVELETVESGEYSQRLHDQEFAIARASWFGDYQDISTFTDKNLSTSDNNDSHWVNPEYDRLCYAAAREPDPQKRLDLLSKAEGILLDEAPLITLYYYTNRYMFRDNVKGILMHPRNLVMLKSVYVEK